MSKCIVHGCTNTFGWATDSEDICIPCYKMLTTGNVGLSYGTNFIHNLRDNLNAAEAHIGYLEGRVKSG